MVDRAGNSLKQAREIKVSSRETTFKDFVGNSDNNDFYKFSFKNRTSFDLKLTGLSADANVELLKKTGKVIADSTNRGKKAEAINLNLDAGTYFIRVYPKSGDTNYQLRLTGNRDQAGETLNQARAIALSSSSKRFKDYVGLSDKNDFYAFSLSESKVVNLTLDGLTADAQLTLLNSNGQVLKASLNGGSTAESISETLEAGDYFIRVFPKGKASSKYTLTGFLETPFIPEEFTQSWINQIGTNASDRATDIALDTNGNLFVSGTSKGNLANANAGQVDGFIGRFDSTTGALEFDDQFGTANLDAFTSVAVASDGTVYGAGGRNLKAEGFTFTGDMYVGQYNAQLVEQDNFTINVSSIDSAAGIATDTSNNIYIVGASISIGFRVTSKSVVRKYDSAGRMQVLGNEIAEITTSGAATDVAVDADGNIYVLGITGASITADVNNPFTNGDTFIGKYDSAGNELWFETLGGGTGSSELGRRLGVDSNGNVYIVGSTTGSLPGNTNAGGTDAFVAKYASDGARKWVKQLGTAGEDAASAISVDNVGNIIVGGYSEGGLFSNATLGGRDAWVAKYNGDGTQIAALQFGTTQDDAVYGAVVDGSNVYLAGETAGSLEGSNAGDLDIWVAQYTLSAIA
jgi:hypothetical protein